MTRDLAALSSQLRAAFVVESQPVLPPVGDAPAVAAEQDPIRALLEVARSFDYQPLTRGGVLKRSSVYALQKRYSDPRDLPLLTLAETRHSLENALRLLTPLRAVPPVEWNTDLVVDLFQTLSPEQRQQAATGTLLVGSLAQGQYASVRRMCSHLYVEPTVDTLRDASVWLRTPTTLHFSTRSKGEGKAVGVTGLLASEPDAWREIGGAESLPPTGTGAQTAEPFWDERHSQSLSSLARLLTESTDAKSTGQTKFRIEVDEACQDKQIMVIGRAYASPDRIMEAASSLYGFRLSRGREGDIQVLRVLPPRPQSGASLADFHPKLLATVPASLRRALHVEESASLDERLRRWSLQGTAERGADDVEDGAKVRQRAGELRRRPEALHSTAVRILARAVSHLEEKRRDRKVTLQELSPLERSAFLLATSPEYLRLARGLAEPVSPVLTDFNNSLLLGREYEDRGKRKLSLGFGVRDPVTGEVKQRSGIFDIDAAGRRREPAPQRP